MTIAEPTVPSAPSGPWTLLARTREGAARESLLLAVAALAAFIVVALVPVFLLQDGWLTLVAGREVAAHGIPRDDALTVMGAGRVWIDQQWLAQLVFYGSWTLGGIKLVLAVASLAMVSALVGGVVVARRSGAAAWAAGAGLVLALLVYPAMLVLRAQTLALPLFVLLYALLRSDARAPSARILCCVPLLALWANLHGSVLLGAVLVVVRVGGRVVGARRLARVELFRTLAVAALLPVAVLATPYGPALAGYYRLMLLDAPFAHYVTEWQRTTLTLETVPFFAVAAGIVLLSLRRARRLLRFEQAALMLLAAAAVDAHRNVVWFALASLVSVPSLLARDVPRARHPVAGVSYGLVAAGAAAATIFVIVVGPFPRAAAVGPVHVGDAAAAAARRDPSLLVFANDRWGDWLLWTHPELAGRIAYDARFELLDDAQLRALTQLHLRGTASPALTRRYRLFILDPTKEAAAEKLLRGRGGRVVAAAERAEAVLIPR